MTWWDFDDVREVETVCGCFSLVRKEAIEQVGLMDPMYFVYGDDPDWCFRFMQKGWKILFTPEPKIIHYGGQTTKQMPREFRWQLYGAKLLFVRLHRPRVSFPLACTLTATFFLLRIPFWFLRSVFGGKRSREHFDIMLTYLLGFFYCLFNWRRMLMNRTALEGI